jgi:bacterioferritin
MKGQADVIDALNGVLTAELTGINQYFVHHRMCRNWGYAKLSHRKYEDSIARMKAADRVIERILLLEGVPNLQRLSPVRVGENPIEQHELDLAAERESVTRLNAAIALAAQKADNGTREMLEKILLRREDAVDWHETQLHLASDVGREEYLSEQIHD